jgi:hypothetical protein
MDQDEEAVNDILALTAGPLDANAPATRFFSLANLLHFQVQPKLSKPLVQRAIMHSFALSTVFEWSNNPNYESWKS